MEEGGGEGGRASAGTGGGESEAVQKVIPPLECCQSFHQWKESLFFVAAAGRGRSLNFKTKIPARKDVDVKVPPLHISMAGQASRSKRGCSGFELQVAHCTAFQTFPIHPGLSDVAQHVCMFKVEDE